MIKVRLGITLGDPGGVGPDIVARLLADGKLFRFCIPHVIGSSRPFMDYLKRLGAAFRVRSGASGAVKLVFSKGTAFFYDPDPRLAKKVKVGRMTGTNGLVALKSLIKAMDLIRQKRIDGIVTGPVSKEAIAKSYPSFRGHTEFFMKKTGVSRVVMFFWSPKLSVALETRHIPLKRVVSSLTKKGLTSSIEVIARSGTWLGLSKPRIAVCGVNPHAGEHGLIGHEDDDVVAPAVKKARSKGINVTGPVSADTLFWQALKGRYDIILALYHDQGLAPFKMIAFDDGVQVSLGLPFVRTSPDHGTAFDIAGTMKASTGSFRQAVRLAASMIIRKKSSTR